MGSAQRQAVEWEERVNRGSASSGVCVFWGRELPCELNRLASELAIPDAVRDQCTSICCDVVEKKLIRRVPLPVIAASSIYAACRESRTPVTIKELAAVSHSDPKDIGRCYRSIMDTMKITPPSPNGTTYAAKVAAKIRASEYAANLSLELVRKAVAKGLGDRNPMTLAAAAVYTACLANGENVRQSDVAEAAGVSVISVRECAKLMRSMVLDHSNETAPTVVQGQTRAD